MACCMSDAMCMHEHHLDTAYEDLKTGLQMVLRDSSVHAVAGGPGDFKALMNVKATIYNWELYQQRSLAYGWHKRFSGNLCQWTGVWCYDGSVAALHFPTNASYLQGAPPQFFIKLPLTTSAWATGSHYFLKGALLWAGLTFRALPPAHHSCDAYWGFLPHALLYRTPCALLLLSSLWVRPWVIAWPLWHGND